jgi:hypothetical protein
MLFAATYLYNATPDGTVKIIATRPTRNKTGKKLIAGTLN